MKYVNLSITDSNFEKQGPYISILEELLFDWLFTFMHVGKIQTTNLWQENLVLKKNMLKSLIKHYGLEQIWSICFSWSKVAVSWILILILKRINNFWYFANVIKCYQISSYHYCEAVSHYNCISLFQLNRSFCFYFT